jgi:rhodanese-related sulfurtransferase
MEPPLEVDCQGVQQLRTAGQPLVLLDCREPEEYAIAKIDGSQLLPMSEIESRLSELEGQQAEPIVVYCHHGMRSAQVATWLRGQGFTGVQSMAGGIDRWSSEIDPKVPRY